MKSLVSIILPVLNGRKFLEERIRTIFDQTYQDFELLIVDSYSEDGSHEYLQQLQDPRIQLWQRPRGLYASWNEAIRRARGEYVYIATADDTMVPDCLEKMVAALEAHPECDLCDSALERISEDGTPLVWSSLPIVDFPVNSAHIRLAPHDGILGFAGGAVYVSITQIMFRRSLLQKCGYFREDFGVRADYEWGIRAGWFANVVYLPQKLSSWRLRAGQATLSVDEMHRKGMVKDIFSEHLKMAQCALHYIADKSAMHHPYWQKRQLLKTMRFRRMLMNTVSSFPVKQKITAAATYFLTYPEELLIYPALFIYKRIHKIKDLSVWRTQRFVAKIPQKAIIIIPPKTIMS